MLASRSGSGERSQPPETLARVPALEVFASAGRSFDFDVAAATAMPPALTFQSTAGIPRDLQLGGIAGVPERGIIEKLQERVTLN
jgi:hypothetical protein